MKSPAEAPISRSHLPADRAWRGAVTGLITAAVALGVGQLVAGLIGPQFSPVATVGAAAIDQTPAPVKNFAIAEFGSHDKTVLVGGILVMLAVFAAAIGIAAVRRLAWGLAGLTLFTVVALAAALTRPTVTAAAVLPALAGGAAGVLALVAMVRAADKVTAPDAAGRAAASSPVPPGSDKTQPSPGPGPQAANTLEGESTRTSPLAGAGAAKASGAGPADSADAPGANWVPPGPRTPAPSPVEPGRRSFLVVSSLAIGAAGVTGLAGRALAERTSVARAQASLRLPRPSETVPPVPAGADLHIPGLSSFITPASSFYRVDTALVLPQVAPESWTLRIHGMVEREMTLTFQDLLHRPLIEDYVTLCCVSNPVGGPYIGNAKWLGPSLAGVLREAGIRAGAQQLLCTSVDGFTSGTPVQTVMDGRDALLAVAMNGHALPVAHGFPVRLVVPGLYGYVSACKWVTDIEVTRWADAQGYWVPRGWSQQAPIKTESRIDVPSLASNSPKAGRTPVAGVAWAQHKGVDAVEVRVDSGPWHQAQLASVPGIDTWRQWVWYWDATPGSHTIEARATDATGYTQTALQVPPEPNGASGYPAVTVTVQ
ncbi:MAG TPA: molybdopterin-dependent oxidoreductase [Streptosporangiaceae bacterium]|nr:molybdopterin-dependent oxidoreductase [Streptosporangiaceae bacterium]